MNRAPLVGRAASGEGVRGVDQARLVVSADADGRAGLAHGGKDASRERLRGVVGGIARDERAARAHVEAEHRRLAQVVTGERRDAIGVRPQPLDHARRVRDGREAARLAQPVVREPRMNGGERRQRARESAPG